MGVVRCGGEVDFLPGSGSGSVWALAQYLVQAAPRRNAITDAPIIDYCKVAGTIDPAVSVEEL